MGVFESWSEQWLGFVAVGLRGSALLFALAFALWWPLRRRLPAQFGYALFLLVLVRLAFPFAVELPPALAVFSPQYLLEAVWVHWTEPPVAVEPREVIATGRAMVGAPPAVAQTFSWWGVAFAVWAAVAGALAIRFAVRQGRTIALVRRARPLEVDELSPSPFQLRKVAGLRRRVRFLATTEVDVPAAGGLFRSYVLVPEGLMAELSLEQRRFVLLHELAHIRRGDLWVALFQRLVGIAFFFHPLVWWANRIIDEQREFACDDAALAACGGRKACGEGFLSVVEWAQGRACAPAGALGMFHSDNVIRRRLMRILDGNRKVGGRSGTLCTLLVLVIGAIAVPAVRAQERKSDRELEMAILQEKLNKLESESRILRLEMEQLRRKGQTGGREANELRFPGRYTWIEAGGDEKKAGKETKKGNVWWVDTRAPQPGQGVWSTRKDGEKGAVLQLDDVTYLRAVDREAIETDDKGRFRVRDYSQGSKAADVPKARGSFQFDTRVTPPRERGRDVIIIEEPEEVEEVEEVEEIEVVEEPQEVEVRSLPRGRYNVERRVQLDRAKDTGATLRVNPVLRAVKNGDGRTQILIEIETDTQTEKKGSGKAGKVKEESVPVQLRWETAAPEAVRLPNRTEKVELPTFVQRVQPMQTETTTVPVRARVLAPTGVEVKDAKIRTVRRDAD